MTMGSPPYLRARQYGRDDIAMGLPDWVEMMLQAEPIRNVVKDLNWVSRTTFTANRSRITADSRSDSVERTSRPRATSSRRSAGPE